MRLTTLSAVGIFALSVVAAAALLPARVDVLFWPGSGPDVTYPTWLYLLLAGASFVLYVVVAGPIIHALRALRTAFHGARRDRMILAPRQVAVLMTSAVLTVALWTAISFPDHDLALRYGIDSLTVLLVVGGTLVAGARGLGSEPDGVPDAD